MAEIQRKTINGINTVSMHGKNYVEVAERVRLVHEQKREFEVIESGPFQIGERCLWKVVVLVDGKRYTGNAEVKLLAKSGPDATNPFECGETSALGRALAFAGFGSVESIASFDEVYRATIEREKEPAKTAIGPKLEDVQALCEKVYGPGKWRSVVVRCIGTEAGDIPDELLSANHLKTIKDALEKRAAAVATTK